MAAAAETQIVAMAPVARLPGELPKDLRRGVLRCNQPIDSSSPCSEPCSTGYRDCTNWLLQSPHRSSDLAAYTGEGWSSRAWLKDCRHAEHGELKGVNGPMEGQATPMASRTDPDLGTLNCDHTDDEDPLNLLRRLDDIIDRLTKSCKEKPDGSLPPLNPSKDPPNGRILEQRLEDIIKRLSERGNFERFNKEDLCVTPPVAKINNPEPRTPTTPRSLLTRSSSAEKVEPLASPTATRSLSRSGRFSSALSFLASPRRAGITVLRIGSPSHKARDGYMER